MYHKTLKNQDVLQDHLLGTKDVGGVLGTLRERVDANSFYKEWAFWQSWGWAAAGGAQIAESWCECEEEVWGSAADNPFCFRTTTHFQRWKEIAEPDNMHIFYFTHLFIPLKGFYQFPLLLAMYRCLFNS